MADPDPGVMVAGQDRVSWSAETYVIRYDDAPKSLNAGGTGSRVHWSKGASEKKMWQGIWAVLLMQQKVPRHMARVRVSALIEFAGKHRRDEENYRSGLAKPLADALVQGGWLADDTAEFFVLEGFHIVSGAIGLGRGKARTTVTLRAQYEVAP